MDKDLIPLLNDQMSIEIPGNITMHDLQLYLTKYINKLIEQDFERLVSILYKIDVDENKLKRILREQTGTDTADIIANLIIERQLKKIETRKQY